VPSVAGQLRELSALAAGVTEVDAQAAADESSEGRVTREGAEAAMKPNGLRDPRRRGAPARADVGRRAGR
jgi:hypothetical protein